MLPPGWTRLDEDVEGLPLWRHGDDPVYVATGDMDLLRCIGMVIVRFEFMEPEELERFANPGS